MPVEGLPDTLQMLLTSLSGVNVLKGWQIYNEKSGDITVKLRFCGDINPSENLHSVSYSRKPQSRLTRDRKRATEYRQRGSDQENNIDDRPTSTPGVIMNTSRERPVTRSVSALANINTSPEQPRNCIDEPETLTLNTSMCELLVTDGPTVNAILEDSLSLQPQVMDSTAETSQTPESEMSAVVKCASVGQGSDRPEWSHLKLEDRYLLQQMELAVKEALSRPLSPPRLRDKPTDRN